jgi:hypothetical protein
MTPDSDPTNGAEQVNQDGGIGFLGGIHTHHHHPARAAGQVRWEIQPSRGRLFELRNIGDASAHEVEVSALHAVRSKPPDLASAWTAGSGHEFFAAGSHQTGRPTITVTWRDDDGVRLSWTRPLPQ